LQPKFTFLDKETFELENHCIIHSKEDIEGLSISQEKKAELLKEWAPMDNALYGVGGAAQFGRRCSRRLPKKILPNWAAPPTPYKALSIGAHSFLICQMGGAAQFGRGCSRRLPKKILFLLGF